MSEHMKEKGYNQRQKRNAKKVQEKAIRDSERKVSIALSRYSHGSSKEYFSYAENRTQTAKLRRISKSQAFQRITGNSLKIGDLKGWNPRTNSVRGILESLIKHIHVTYPVPNFLYNAFISDIYPDRTLALFTLKHLTNGGKPKDLLGTAIDAPLTKKMIHLFLSSTQPTFVRAIREAQFKAQGGDPTVFRAFILARPRVYETIREKRYFEVISWLSKIGMIEHGMVGPMLDFFDYQYRINLSYSLKGRTAHSVMSAMEEWHKELQKSKIVGPQEYPPLPGVNSFSYKKFVGRGEGRRVASVFTITPILSGKDLAKEGKSLGHCVASYSRSMINGHSYIWSMSENGARKLTIQVNERLEIIQARGKYNRTPTNSEKMLIKRWANENQLTIRLYYW